MKDYAEAFRGIYPALLTPFDSEYRINEKALRQLVRLNLDKGVQGFYVCGSTAEAFMLSVEDRKKILDIVTDENAGKAKIIAHVGAISQLQATDLARHAQAAGADMISSICPFYYGFPFKDLKAFYYDLADSVDLPVLVYYFPANSGVKFTLDMVEEFLCDERFAGVKFTNNDFFMLQQIKAHYPKAAVFNGYDEMFLCGISMGADGGVGSTYNFMAEKYLGIMEAFRNGNITAAQKLQFEANAILAKLIKYGVMPAEKAILEMMGIPMGNCLKPFAEVSEEAKKDLRETLLSNGCSL